MEKSTVFSIILGIGLVFGGVFFSYGQLISPVPINTNSESAASSKVGCNLFLKDLKYGMKSEDVRILQKYLIDNSYLKTNATKYFGPATLLAVKNFQKANNISSTGYFGPITRGVFRSIFCPIIEPPIIVDPGPNQPPESCKVWYDGCNTCSRSEVGGELACTKMMCIMGGDQDWFMVHKPKCNEYFPGYVASPVISSVSGPTTLKIGETGSWFVSASIADNSQLTYDITWGDEIAYPVTAGLSVKSISDVYTQGSTFQHIYNTAGLYKVIIRARAQNGQVVESTQTVNVIGDSVISIPSDSCKIWFDGCNTCSREYPDGPMMCTMMACLTSKQIPYCKATF